MDWTIKKEKNLRLFHEFNGVETSMWFRIDSAKFDENNNKRIIPATPKLTTKFCIILLFVFLFEWQIWFISIVSRG